MAQLPPIELLESTHTFPGPYTFKVIGSAANEFLGRVLNAAREALNSDSDPKYTIRETEGGKHQAITLTVYVEKAAEIHAVYNRILDVRGLVLLL